MKVKMNPSTEVEISYIRINAYISYWEKSYGGYVPEFMYPNKKGFGDYIILNIDENGYIQNWDKDLVAKFLENCK